VVVVDADEVVLAAVVVDVATNSQNQQEFSYTLLLIQQ